MDGFLPFALRPKEVPVGREKGLGDEGQNWQGITPPLQSHLKRGLSVSYRLTTND